MKNLNYNNIKILKLTNYHLMLYSLSREVFEYFYLNLISPLMIIITKVIIQPALFVIRSKFYSNIEFFYNFSKAKFIPLHF